LTERVGLFSAEASRHPFDAFVAKGDNSIRFFAEYVGRIDIVTSGVLLNLGDLGFDDVETVKHILLQRTRFDDRVFVTRNKDLVFQVGVIEQVLHDVCVYDDDGFSAEFRMARTSVVFHRQDDFADIFQSQNVFSDKVIDGSVGGAVLVNEVFGCFREFEHDVAFFDFSSSTGQFRHVNLFDVVEVDFINPVGHFHIRAEFVDISRNHLAFNSQRGRCYAFSQFFSLAISGSSERQVTSQGNRFRTSIHRDSIFYAEFAEDKVGFLKFNHFKQAVYPITVIEQAIRLCSCKNIRVYKSCHNLISPLPL